jgi:hypothetical protein
MEPRAGKGRSVGSRSAQAGPGGAEQGTGATMDLPWTAGLPAAFRARHGYDLLPHLVELFYDVDGQEMTPARHDYHNCVTALFVDSFSRQVGEWCEENGLLHVGHVLMEDRLSDQSDVMGSAMRFYEHMQTPGMDLLTERWRAFTTAKQVSSVAHQFGRAWRLTETYGCTGWDFPFAGHKALGDWQVALGITLRGQHLAWYGMGGQAKRDYPAAISPQSPWWDMYPAVEDYFARLHAVMTRGEEVRDIFDVPPVRERTLAFPSVTIRAWLAAEGTPRELDPRTGEEHAAGARKGRSGEWEEITSSFTALGSRLFSSPRPRKEPVQRRPRVPRCVTPCA